MEGELHRLPRLAVYDTCTKHTAACCFNASETVEGAYSNPDWPIARNVKCGMGNSSGGISFDGLCGVHMYGTRTNSAGTCLQNSMEAEQSTYRPSSDSYGAHWRRLIIGGFFEPCHMLIQG